MRQPFAGLISRDIKSIEIRSWATTYRGALAIHASLGHVHRSIVDRIRREYPDSLTWPRGVIVAIAKLVDVRPLRFADRSAACVTEFDLPDVDGRFAWMLDDVVALKEPVPCIGRLSLFKLHPAVLERLRSSRNERGQHA